MPPFLQPAKVHLISVAKNTVMLELTAQIYLKLNLNPVEYKSPKTIMTKLHHMNF